MIQQEIKKFSVCFAFLFCVCLALLPLAANAGLVPCGIDDNNNNIIDESEQCTWCHLGELVKNIIDFLVKIVIAAAAALVLWGGFVIMTAGASPERAKHGRDIIKAAVIGIIIALGAWLIIDTIIKTIATGWSDSLFGPWNEISC